MVIEKNNQQRKSGITRVVVVLSMISLFTDTASEMLYPVMPVYLKEIGFSILLIGILEGIAEAVSGLSKGYFGRFSDLKGKRAPFVQIGYALSALSKPLMVAYVFPWWVFMARTIDRIGKGIRTGARDAILSDEATPETKGRVFGFHRSMDTIGAVIGPAFALLYLHYHPSAYKDLFIIAFIPGLLSILLSMNLKDGKRPVGDKKPSPGLTAAFSYWRWSPKSYRKLVIGLLLFTLFNSSDVFLLLKARQSGLDDSQIIIVYIFYNLVYAIFSYPAGQIADRIGLKSVLITGMLIFSLVYLGISFCNSLYGFFLLFGLYGIYASSTEGISKAWISNISNKADTAAAIGTYTGFQSICTMMASFLAGFLWYHFGAPITFIVSGAMAIVVVGYFYRLVPYQKPEMQVQPPNESE